MTIRNRLYLILAVFVGLILISVVSIKAAESGSRSFAFRIQANQANTSTAYSLYRDVAKTDYTKPWYVYMTKSEEGPNTYTRYWLELNNGTNVSRGVDAKVGTEYHPSAYGTANSEYVYLTAENNNSSSLLYTVNGYWKAKSSY